MQEQAPPQTTTEVVPEKEPSAVDIATRDFEALIPMFKAKLEELSNAQLKRVVSALMEFPFQKEPIRFSYPQESELFNFGVNILDCRFVIIKTVLDMKQDELKDMMGSIEPIKGVENGRETKVAEDGNDSEEQGREVKLPESSC